MPVLDLEEISRGLCARLSGYRVPRPLVLALPPGGIPMAQLVAQGLGGDLEMMQAECLVVEGYRGAVAETGEVELDSAESSSSSEARFAGRIVDRVSRMLLRRVQWLPGSSVPRVSGRIVILVADGLATGARMRAALASLRSHGACRVVAVALAATQHSIDRLTLLADEVVCLMTHSSLGSVGRSLRRWRHVPEDVAFRMLRPGGGLRRRPILELP